MAELTVHVDKKATHRSCVVLDDGALVQILSLQVELAESQKQVAPEEFLIQAASKEMSAHVVFTTQPPPVFVIQLFDGK